MALLIDNLTVHIPYDWIRNNLTIYADDIFVHCLFTDLTQLDQAIGYFDRILHAIEQLGLQLSPSKSCVITRGKGPGFDKWKKKHTSTDSFRVHHLLLREGAMHIPLKKKTMHLGVHLSYDQFERQSVELRVQAGWNNFRRLQPWLCKRHRVTLSLRLELMRTCIVPTLCYGIIYTGLHERDIQLVCQTLHQMYRRVLGNIPHRTRETHSSVLDRYNIASPLVLLEELTTQAHQSLNEALLNVSLDDVIHFSSWKPLLDTRTLLISRLCHPEQIPDTDSEPSEITCIYCAFIAPSLSQLQRHQTLVHAMPRSIQRRVDYTKDTTDGMPRCKHCQKIFLTWRSFTLHCRANVCGHPTIKPPETPFFPPDVWDWEDTVIMEPGPQHQEHYDRGS